MLDPDLKKPLEEKIIQKIIKFNRKMQRLIEFVLTDSGPTTNKPPRKNNIEPPPAATVFMSN